MNSRHMALAYTVNHLSSRVYQTAVGELGIDDVIGVAERQAADPDAWTYGTVLDLTHADLRITLQDVERYLRRVEALVDSVGPRGAMAFVVSGTSPSIGWVRMFRILADPSRITVEMFASLDAADRWLAARVERHDLNPT